MKKCKNCLSRFKWKSIVRSIFWGYKPINCENCNTKHHVYFTTRLMTMLLFGIIMFFVYTKPVYGSNLMIIFSIKVSILLLLFALLMWISPLYAKYYIKD